jgi:hypothetical protein
MICMLYTVLCMHEKAQLAISHGSVCEDGVIISACEKLLCNVSVCVIV